MKRKIGVYYFVNWNGRLVPPIEAPDYWATPGRFFIHSSLIFNSPAPISIRLYNEVEENFEDLELLNDKPFNIFYVNVSKFGRLFWQINSFSLSNNMSKWLEIEPLNKTSLEILYLKKKRFFIGVNSED